MIRALRWLLLVLDVGNWLAFAFFAGMAALLAFGLPPATGHVIHVALPGTESRMAHLMIVMLLIGCATAFAVDMIFRRLLHVLKTVDRGQPFIPANGTRLRDIAWALLSIQLLDLAFAWVVGAINHVARHPVFTWSPSVTGWLAVLLLFVLARVFAQGTAMQDDLEGTV